MQKLSQKELLEGFGSNLMKSVGRGIAGAAKTAAKMISPTAVDVAKKAGDKVGGAIANIAYGSPKAALQEYFNRPEVKSKYKDFQVDSSKDINKMRKKLVVSVTDVKTNKKVTGEVEAYRTDSGGMAAETWGFDKFKLSNGDVITQGSGQPGKGDEAGRGDKEDDGIIKRGAEAIGKSALKGAEAVGGAALGGVKNVGKSALKGAETVAGDVYEKGKEIAGSNQLPDPDELYSPAQEEPVQEPQSQEEPVQEPQSQEEPQLVKPSREDVEAAIAATELPGFKKGREEEMAIKKIKEYLNNTSPRNAPNLTWAEQSHFQSETSARMFIVGSADEPPASSLS